MNPGLISSELGWHAKLELSDIVERMLENRLL